MGQIVGRETDCNQRVPAEKHEWYTTDGMKRRSGHNWLKLWRCRKCGAVTSNQARLKS